MFGLPLLERHHPFHGKLSPGCLSGNRCNHDLGLVWAFPVLSDALRASLEEGASDVLGESAARDERFEDALDLSLQLIVDHELYASDYSTTMQPQAANLLHTLHDSLVRHDRFAAERAAAGKSDALLDKARRLLQSLVMATNRRQHTGFPTIYAYLLGKPNHYTSHEFQPLPTYQVMDWFVSALNLSLIHI